MEPVWENFWQVSRAVTRLGIYLCNIREVSFSIALSVSGDLTIVKLLDPLGRDAMTFPNRDGERGKFCVSNVPFKRGLKCFLVTDEAGVGIVKVFFHFVEGFFILPYLFSQLDGNICLALVCSKDKGLNNGTVHRCIQVIAVNEVVDTVRRELSQGLVGVE